MITQNETRRKRRDIIRGRLAFLIADNLTHEENRSTDDLLKIVDAILAEFQVSRRPVR